MGEIIPFLAMALFVLAVLGLFLLKGSFNKKVVVKPLEEEDLVERVKIPLKDTEAEELAGKLMAAAKNAVDSGIPILVTSYLEGRTDRMVQFEVTGTRPKPKSKTV